MHFGILLKRLANRATFTAQTLVVSHQIRNRYLYNIHLILGIKCKGPLCTAGRQ